MCHQRKKHKLLCHIPLLCTAINIHTVNKIDWNFIIVSWNKLVFTSGLSYFCCLQLIWQWGLFSRPLHQAFISDWKVNLIDTSLIVRLASSMWLTHVFSIQFQPQMGTATNPKTLLKLHKMNYVDNNISSGLELGCVLSKAVKLCKWIAKSL